jgi:uncharacterized cupin superfamily protein
MTKRIDMTAIEPRIGSGYPPPFDAPCRERVRLPLGEAAGLTRIGVNLLRLPPGAWSTQRHWHVNGDEFVFVVAGEVVLVTNAGTSARRRCGGFRQRRARRPPPAEPFRCRCPGARGRRPRGG